MCFPLSQPQKPQRKDRLELTSPLLLPPVPLPPSTEAERARQVLHDSTQGLIITKVETTVDEIVFVDLKEGEFASPSLHLIFDELKLALTSSFLCLSASQESALLGRSVLSAERKGKLYVFSHLADLVRDSTRFPRAQAHLLPPSSRRRRFWLNLSGSQKHPVFHLGMTGMIQLKGGEPVLYQSRSSGSDEVWPPRFWKASSTSPSLPPLSSSS